MKSFVLLLCLSMSCVTAFSQREVDDRTPWNLKDRAYLGLGFGGLGFGTHPSYGTYFSVGLSPMAGSMITKNFSSGVAFEYQYTSYSDQKIKIHQYGWYPFLRYNIKNVFVQADYDWYSVPRFVTVTSQERVILDRFFVGLGYSNASPGSRSAVNILASYDLLYTNTSPFSSPLSFRIFMTF